MNAGEKCDMKGISVVKSKLWEQKTDGRHRVTLTSFIPDERKSDAAVIICPGGSYFWLDKRNEGIQTAKELASNGIAAFVLEYRVAGKVNFITDIRLMYNGNQFPRMLNDIQYAIQHVRKRAEQYRINPDKIGAMGFSAGGHLVMMAAEAEELGAKIENFSHIGKDAMPDFVVPIYPVVTMCEDEYVHRRSRRALMGNQRKNTMQKEHLSVDRNIPQDCCPVFLVNCKDDSTVDYRNSVILDRALTEKGIKHVYIQFPAGGHGFGVKPITHKGTTYSWIPDFYLWLQEL